MTITLSEKDVRRFFRYVEVTDDGSCWEWLGGKYRDGYGGFWLQGASHKAHRITWLIEYGEFPKNDACHSCDNRGCVNPKHLFDGTSSENRFDALAKGRVVPLRGVSHGQAKLTEDDIREIRQLYQKANPSYRSIASMYGVTHRAISQIIQGITWTHVE